MLRRGQREFSLDLSQSVMVGDRCSDMAAANAAHLAQAFLLQGTETSGCEGAAMAVQRLDEVASWLIERG